MQSLSLRRYLDLEQAMVQLDGLRNPEADRVRDLMDDAWCIELTEEERTWINLRELPPLGNEIRLSVGVRLFISHVAMELPPAHGYEFRDWLIAA